MRRFCLGCLGCLGFGSDVSNAVSSVKEYVTTAPRDIPYGDKEIVVMWHNRRWRCGAVDCARASFTEAISDDNGGADVQLAGFRIVNYSADQASIILAASVGGQTNSYPRLSIAMQWYDGDWRAIPQAGPALFVAVAPVPSLAGFVPWSKVS